MKVMEIPWAFRGRRRAALDVLQRHGLVEQYYFPAAGCDNEELAEALRFLGSTGHLVTDETGLIVGKFAKASLSSEERAQAARKRFVLIPKD